MDGRWEATRRMVVEAAVGRGDFRVSDGTVRPGVDALGLPVPCLRCALDPWLRWMPSRTLSPSSAVNMQLFQL